jgi:hypothetical protein
LYGLLYELNFGLTKWEAKREIRFKVVAAAVGFEPTTR